MEKPCERCGKLLTTTTKRLAQGRGRFCSHSCAKTAQWAATSRTTPRYRYVRAVGHPLANANGTVLEHRLALYGRIGSGPHRCHWCSTPVDWAPGRRTAPGALVVDHLDGDGRNNQPTNLLPSCHRCNAARGRKNLVGDDEPYVLMTGNRGRHRAVQRVCPCGKEFLALAADKRPNGGRFCSRSCARRKHPIRT